MYKNKQYRDQITNRHILNRFLNSKPYFSIKHVKGNQMELQN